MLVPEEPLAAGIVDQFQEQGLRIFGPNQEQAKIESSKIYAKQLMKAAKVPTPPHRLLENYGQFENKVQTLNAPYVLKEDGLAAGKGVRICNNYEEAYQFAQPLFDQGKTLILEDYLKGQECSVIAFVNAKKGQYVLLEACQDHKQACDGDTGLNTGGMGAYSPMPQLPKEMLQVIEDSIFKRVIDRMEDYTGILYAGLMLDIAHFRAYVLEFNCRFGDPEAQPLLMRMKTDLLDLIDATLDGELENIELEWDERAALSVVMASEGYPKQYPKGISICGLEQAVDENVKVFHAGTKVMKGNRLVTNGGRVFSVTALGENLEVAQVRAYKAIDKIHFPGGFCRYDIGNKGINGVK